ncbi:LmrA/YxaF family transcription factor [Sphingopyxis sp. 550A]
MAVTKGDRTRARLIESMLELIQAKGYSGTGLNAVNEHAGTPKGSLYFHFPEGKEALGQEAVELAAARFGILIQEAAAQAKTPSDVIIRAIDILAAMLTESDFQLGCPISVVTLDMGAESERLRTTCAAAYQSWIGPLTEFLTSCGHSGAAARALATTVVSTVEGAIIVSRAQHSVEPLRLSAQVLSAFLDSGVTISPEKGSAA